MQKREKANASSYNYIEALFNTTRVFNDFKADRPAFTGVSSVMTLYSLSWLNDSGVNVSTFELYLLHRRHNRTKSTKGMYDTIDLLIGAGYITADSKRGAARIYRVTEQGRQALADFNTLLHTARNKAKKNDKGYV